MEAPRLGRGLQARTGGSRSNCRSDLSCWPSLTSRRRAPYPWPFHHYLPSLRHRTPITALRCQMAIRAPGIATRGATQTVAEGALGGLVGPSLAPGHGRPARALRTRTAMDGRTAMNLVTGAACGAADARQSSIRPVVVIRGSQILGTLHPLPQHPHAQRTCANPLHGRHQGYLPCRRATPRAPLRSAGPPLQVHVHTLSSCQSTAAARLPCSTPRLCHP